MTQSHIGWPHIDWLLLMPVLLMVTLVAALIVPFAVGGRSPHVTYRPEQINVRLDDVKGIDARQGRSHPVTQPVPCTQAVRGGDGWVARDAACCSRVIPGTGKTFLAKAMAREAGVPFVFVSATSFQSMYYGATARKIRSYFKHLRKVARQEGGAIGFIEEIDAIAMTRSGMSPATSFPDSVASSSASLTRCGGLTGLPSVYEQDGPAVRRRSVSGSMMSEGVGGVVNELLVQMQSFDEPTGWQKVRTKAVNAVNLYLPADPAAPAASAPAHQPAAHRGHQPRRQPGPGAAASRPLRPPAHLRASRPAAAVARSSTTT